MIAEPYYVITCVDHEGDTSYFNGLTSIDGTCGGFEEFIVAERYENLADALVVLNYPETRCGFSEERGPCRYAVMKVRHTLTKTAHVKTATMKPVDE